MAIFSYFTKIYHGGPLQQAYKKLTSVLQLAYSIVIGLKYLRLPSNDKYQYAIDAYERIFNKDLAKMNKIYFYLCSTKMIHIYEIEGDKAGFALFCLNPPFDFHLFAIGIEEQYRGTGCGRRSLSNSMDYWKEMGFQTLSLWVEQDNYKALNLYKSLGFNIVKDADYKFYMRKTLSAKS